jgi:hypothetical protein
MKARHLRRAVFLIAVLAMGVQVCSAGTNPKQRLEQLLEASSLNSEALKPWHLHMTYDLKGLDGAQEGEWHRLRNGASLRRATGLR